MAKFGIVTDYDDAGYPQVAAFTANVTIGTTQTVKAGPGRLLKIIVSTVTATAVTTIYDNASAASGTILAVIPIAAAVGTVYDINLPALAGITVAGAGTGALVIGYS
jgi:hypothetical protein